MRKCTICGKTYIQSITRKKLRGKYNPTSKKKKYPNLQWVQIPIDVKKEAYRKFAGKRVKACTKCIKTLHKTK